LDSIAFDTAFRKWKNTEPIASEDGSTNRKKADYFISFFKQD